MKTTIGKKFTFESSHQLVGEIYGKCQNLHGHRYELTVEVEGEVDRFGWVCDFAEIEEIVKKNVLDKLDHRNINDSVPVSTAENIAKYIFRILDSELKSRPYNVSRIILYETADSYAEITRQ